MHKGENLRKSSKDAAEDTGKDSEESKDAFLDEADSKEFVEICDKN